MRSRWLVAAGTIAALIALTWLVAPARDGRAPRTAAPDPRATSAEGGTRRAPTPASVGATGPIDRAPAPEWQRTFEARVSRVDEACGLPVHTRCEGTGCAAVVVSPDLDRFGGWVRLVRQNPRFVLQTAARDLGLPPALLTCGDAVAALSADGATASVERPDGTEIWCLPTDPSGRTTWDDAQRALCARAAAEHAGHEVPGFDAPSLRRLRFRRD